MSVPQRTGFDRLPALEGWAPVVRPQIQAKADAAIKVALVMTRGILKLKLSISAKVFECLGGPTSFDVSENRVEKALMVVPRSDDFGFMPKIFGKNLKNQANMARRQIELEPWSNMPAETVQMEANGEVVDWKGAPCLVIRLPYGLFPSTGFTGARK
jgi:hypothetical protein